MDKVNTSPVDDKTTQVSDEIEVKTPLNPDDKVAYETYSKVIGEKKKLALENERLRAIASKATDLEKKLTEKEQEEMEKSGKTSELIESLKKTLADQEMTLKQKEERILKGMISEKIKVTAIKHGCVNPDKLLRLLDKADIAELDVDFESYSVDERSIESLIEKAKKEHEDIGLFSRRSVSVKDGSPTTGLPASSDWREAYQAKGFKEAFIQIKSK